MNWLIIILLQRRIKIAEKIRAKYIENNDSIFAAAYFNMITAYKNTILFLKVDKK